MIELEPDAISVQALDATQLLIVFTTGEKKVFDMTELLCLPVYQKLRQPHEFEKVHIRHGVVTWDDTTDLAPETAYLASHPLDANTSC